MNLYVKNLIFCSIFIVFFSFFAPVSALAGTLKTYILPEQNAVPSYITFETPTILTRIVLSGEVVGATTTIALTDPAHITCYPLSGQSFFATGWSNEKQYDTGEMGDLFGIDPTVQLGAMDYCEIYPPQYVSGVFQYSGLFTGYNETDNLMATTTVDLVGAFPYIMLFGIGLVLAMGVFFFIAFYFRSR